MYYLICILFYVAFLFAAFMLLKYILKKPEKNEIRLSSDILEKYFPKNYTPQKMQEVIIKLLESWQRKRQMNHER